MSVGSCATDMRPFPKKFDLKALKGEREALLTGANPKLEKGIGYGYGSWLMHLAPARLSGTEVCPWRSPGCTAACLNNSGRGGLSKIIPQARLRRTRWFLEDPDSFLEALQGQIARAIRYTEGFGLTPTFRLNGTSDLAWEDFAGDIFARFRGYKFYDYTKGIERVMGRRPANYHLTFSRSETNLDECREALRVTNVAVVYGVRRGEDLPTRDRALGVRVIDGDISDLRFLDRPRRGVVVGLRLKELRDPKGRQRKEAGVRSGFVTNPPLSTPDLETQESAVDAYAGSQVAFVPGSDVAFDPHTGERVR